MESKHPSNKRAKIQDKNSPSREDENDNKNSKTAESETAIFDTIKFFDNARRFEKSVGDSEQQKKDDGDDDSDTGADEREFVELYWDNNGNNLKKVKGLHRKYQVSDEEGEPELNSSRMLPTPTVEEAEYNNVTAEAERQAGIILAEEGFEEIKDFIILHRAHIPCFTWITSDEIADEAGSEISSQIGGYPLLYKDEEWPGDGGEDHLFAFQIDLSTVPKRMQSIVGTSGLLQLFWNNEDVIDEGFCRIIPPEDYTKLHRRRKVVTCEQGPNYTTKYGLITGWVERPDYPGSGNTMSVYGEEHFERMQSNSDYLRIDYDKFGGYSIYCQDGDCPYDEPCDICGESHLNSHAVFNMVDSGMLRIGLGDLGTVQVSYCPNNPKKEFDIEGSCY